MNDDVQTARPAHTGDEQSAVPRPGETLALIGQHIPLCTSCRKRPARRHGVIGWYKSCEKCRERRTPQVHRLCGGCKQRPPSYARTVCSIECQRLVARRTRARAKAAVIAALGGACSCRNADCPSCAGNCAIAAGHLLDVEHTKNDGAHARRKLKGTGQHRRGGAMTWTRYRRALQVNDHGMVLLCANCHRHVEHLKRRGKHVAMGAPIAEAIDLTMVWHPEQVADWDAKRARREQDIKALIPTSPDVVCTAEMLMARSGRGSVVMFRLLLALVQSGQVTRHKTRPPGGRLQYSYVRVENAEV